MAQPGPVQEFRARCGKAKTGLGHRMAQREQPVRLERAPSGERPGDAGEHEHGGDDDGGDRRRRERFGVLGGGCGRMPRGRRRGGRCTAAAVGVVSVGAVALTGVLAAGVMTTGVVVGWTRAEAGTGKVGVVEAAWVGVEVVPRAICRCMLTPRAGRTIHSAHAVRSA